MRHNASHARCFSADKQSHHHDHSSRAASQAPAAPDYSDTKKAFARIQQGSDKAKGLNADLLRSARKSSTPDDDVKRSLSTDEWNTRRVGTEVWLADRQFYSTQRYLKTTAAKGLFVYTTSQLYWLSDHAVTQWPTVADFLCHHPYLAIGVHGGLAVLTMLASRNREAPATSDEIPPMTERPVLIDSPTALDMYLVHGRQYCPRLNTRHKTYQGLYVGTTAVTFAGFKLLLGSSFGSWWAAALLTAHIVSTVRPSLIRIAFTKADTRWESMKQETKKHGIDALRALDKRLGELKARRAELSQQQRDSKSSDEVDKELAKELRGVEEERHAVQATMDAIAKKEYMESVDINVIRREKHTSADAITAKDERGSNGEKTKE